MLFAYAFAGQIYCDFSAYTDIARGVAKLFNIELTRNFLTPYFASSPADFWRRWHISLSTWLRDYLYIPLGGNRHGTLRTLRQPDDHDGAGRAVARRRHRVRHYGAYISWPCC